MKPDPITLLSYQRYWPLVASLVSMNFDMYFLSEHVLQMFSLIVVRPSRHDVRPGLQLPIRLISDTAPDRSRYSFDARGNR